MIESRHRQIAYKVWITELINSKYIIQEGWNPNYLEINGKKVSRVNILASVINIYKNDIGNYMGVTLDDGSSNIRVKAFHEDIKFLEDVNVGDSILVIGRPRESNNEIYILPEIIRKMDPKWIKVRKLELPVLKEEINSKSNTIINPAEDEGIVKDYIEEDYVESKSNDNIRQKILNLIENSGEGIDKFEILNKLDSDNVESFIQELLKEGEIYEVKGKLRILE